MCRNLGSVPARWYAVAGGDRGPCAPFRCAAFVASSLVDRAVDHAIRGAAIALVGGRTWFPWLLSPDVDRCPIAGGDRFVRPSRRLRADRLAAPSASKWFWHVVAVGAVGCDGAGRAVSRRDESGGCVAAVSGVVRGYRATSCPSSVRSDGSSDCGTRSVRGHPAGPGTRSATSQTSACSRTCSWRGAGSSPGCRSGTGSR